jgi:hypothetical protein
MVRTVWLNTGIQERQPTVTDGLYFTGPDAFILKKE